MAERGPYSVSRARRRAVHAATGALALIALGDMAGAAPAGPALAGSAAATTRMDGFIPLRWDAAKGRVLMEIPAFDQDILYYVSAATGGGSVELPLDRGVMYSAVIRFQQAGAKVLVTEINQDYRSLGGDGAHAQGVADSFPTSVLAALPIESNAGGKVVVDATALFMRDAANIESTLKRANQGTYKFDAARSSFITLILSHICSCPGI